MTNDTHAYEGTLHQEGNILFIQLELKDKKLPAPLKLDIPLTNGDKLNVKMTETAKAIEGTYKKFDLNKPGILCSRDADTVLIDADLKASHSAVLFRDEKNTIIEKYIEQAIPKTSKYELV